MILAHAIGQLGDFDLILLGREAGDWGEGQTAGLLAERLGLPCVAFVDQIKPAEGGVQLQRQTDFGREALTARLPLVLSITNHEANVPRIPKTRDIMMAHRKELQLLTLEEIGLDAETVRQTAGATQVVELYVPEKTSQCEFISGDSLEDRIRIMADRLVQVLGSV